MVVLRTLRQPARHSLVACTDAAARHRSAASSRGDGCLMMVFQTRLGLRSGTPGLQKPAVAPQYRCKCREIGKAERRARCEFTPSVVFTGLPSPLASFGEMQMD